MNFQKAIHEANRRLVAACYLPVVTSEEGAKAFFEGADKLNKMKASEIEALNSLSDEELSKHPNKAVAYTYGACKFVTDTLFGIEDEKNRFLQKHGITPSMKRAADAKAKEFHTNSRVEPTAPAYALRSLIDEAMVDSGWMAAFRMGDFRGLPEVKVSELFSKIRWFKTKKLQDAQISSLDYADQDVFGYDTYASGVMLDNYESRFMVMQVNEILTQMRITHLINKARVGYQHIFDAKDVKSLALQTPNLPSAPNDYDKWIYTLEEAIRDLKLRAYKEANGLISDASPVLMYAHATHRLTMNTLFNRLPGENGVNLQFVSNIQPIFTYHASDAFSGRHTVNLTKTDEFGFPTTASKDGDKKTGVMLVLPGLNHHYGAFSDLSFGESERLESDSTTLIGRYRDGYAMDPRFKQHVALN